MYQNVSRGGVVGEPLRFPYLRKIKKEYFFLSG